MRLSLTTCALLMVGTSAAASNTQRQQQQSLHQYNIEGHLDEFPDTGREWISLSEGNGIEFQPAEDFDLSMLDDDMLSEQLAQQQQSRRQLKTSGYEASFVDGSGTYYNDYAQAWRLLGFYTDCNAPLNNVNECYDDGDGDGEAACQRFLLWAAVRILSYLILN